MEKYKNIEYLLERSTRKRTISLYIEREGILKIIAPQDMEKSEIERVIKNKISWIVTNLTQWHELNKTKMKRDIISGEGFLYLGRSYKLKITEKIIEPIKIYQGKLYLNKNILDKAEDVIQQFYKNKALLKISERVNIYKYSMGLSPKEIKIMNLQNRWASCTDDGKLIFNWKLIMAPLNIVDYIVVHELSHFIYKNHSPEFWKLIDKVMPDFEERKKWLKENGASLDI